VLNRIESETGRLADQKLASQTERSNAEDVDMVHAISEFQNKQSGYDAALKSYAMVQRPVVVPVRQRLTRGGRAASPQGAELLDVAILGQVALGYSPFIDRNRAVAATRLSVYPLRPTPPSTSPSCCTPSATSGRPAAARSRSTSSARACSTTCCAPAPRPT
jgi:hypothetical protein